LFRTILLVLAFVILLPSTGFAQPADDEFGRWPFPGSVDELPEGTRPGEAFNGFPDRQRNIEWFAIPEWLAGDWASGDLRILKSYDHVNDKLRTIPSSTVVPMSDHFGDQVDRQGTIWSCNFTPFIINMQLAGLTDSQLTIGMKPLEVNDEGVAIWQRIYHVLFLPNNQIHDSFTEERVTEFAPQAPGMIMAQCTSKFFDAHGEARTTTNSLRIMRRGKPWKPQAQRAGINLPMSFSEFLQATGRGELIP
jgi:hypothetical protein